MFFNSYGFILGFLPVVLLGFSLLGARAPGLAKGWLTLASLFFYGWWNPIYLTVIVSAMLVNYGIGSRLINKESSHRRLLMGLGVTANLCLLGWFKYSAFFVNSVAAFTGASFHLEAIALPLAISFFTFQKIAFLVDAYHGRIDRCGFVDYCLFVTFFPQLIAGPIVHYREIAPQISDGNAFRLRADNVSVGLTLFAFGLFKKVVIADAIALHANAVFNGAATGLVPNCAGAWAGALAYTLQLYFDFSGYSDMAIGLARIFNIRLPLNFNSPYKAADIADFWRRWHITLSSFLRDYLYIPLGGNRKGPARRNINLLLTMLLGGFWHGAGWSFLLWGALHGGYLVIFHAWRNWTGAVDPQRSVWRRVPGAALTFLCVVVGWVCFRSDNLTTAFRLLRSMAGLAEAPAASPVATSVWLLIAGLLAVVWLAPNTQELLSAHTPNLNSLDKVPPRAPRILWRPGFAWSLVVSLVLIWAFSCLARPSQFLYFQF